MCVCVCVCVCACVCRKQCLHCSCARSSHNIETDPTSIISSLEELTLGEKPSKLTRADIDRLTKYAWYPPGISYGMVSRHIIIYVHVCECVCVSTAITYFVSFVSTPPSFFAVLVGSLPLANNGHHSASILSFFHTYMSQCVCVFCNLISIGNCWQSAPLELIVYCVCHFITQIETIVNTLSLVRIMCSTTSINVCTYNVPTTKC